MRNVLGSVLIIAALVSVGAFVIAERAFRSRWSDRLLGDELVGSPYRVTVQRMRAGTPAPRLIRAAALSGLVLGGVALPGTLWAVMTLQFDGLAVAFLPLLTSTLCTWCTAWLLLARNAAGLELGVLAVHLARTSSMMLVVLALLHEAATCVGWADRASTPYVSLALVLSLATFPQASILFRALSRHGAMFPQGRRG